MLLHQTRRRGAATVEFAVVLPLLLIMLLGLWEVGRLIEAQQVLENAAREGGRQASNGKRSEAAVKQAVVDYIQRAGFNSTGVTVSVTNVTGGGSDPLTAQQLDRFRVSVALPVANVRWVFVQHFTTRETLTATSDWYSMRDSPLTISSEIPVE